MFSLLDKKRKKYFQLVCSDPLSFRKGTQVPNIADKSSRASIDLATRYIDKMNFKIGKTEKSPQSLGELFPKYTLDYLKECFDHLQHIRPGHWIWSVSQAKVGISAFDQYEHLAHLQDVLDAQPELKSAFGGDYLITPDIVVARQAISDERINERKSLIDNKIQNATLSPLREKNIKPNSAILHASISCKWTMRSDRSQNTRTEALNLIRNRKGNTPHIIVVTSEPLPNRLASIAMGTGDVDCTYHIALHELMEAAQESSFDDQADLLNDLVNGSRLRDISDLPFDLAI